MADKKGQRFTIDSEKEGAEVPTLTKLLYRKNVVKSQGSPGSGRQGRGLDAGSSREQDRSRIMTLEPTLTGQSDEPEAAGKSSTSTAPMNPEFVVSQIASNIAQPLNMGAATGASTDRRIMPAATPFTMPATVRPVRPQKYSPSEIACAGIRTLFEKTKVDSALVFEEDGEFFRVESIVTTSMERVTLWSGMEISKSVFPDLIGRLKKFGFAEFSTLGATGEGNFDRITFRAAFQAKNAEWLTLIRVKSATLGDAIVVVVSGGSIQMHLPAFHSAEMPAAKAA